MPEKTIQELLQKATEAEFFGRQRKAQHEQAIELVQKLDIAWRGFSSISPNCFNEYYDREEIALIPALEWEVGRSKLKVHVLLITQIFDAEKRPGTPSSYDFVDDSDFTPLGFVGLRSADPLVRILLNVFQQLRSDPTLRDLFTTPYIRSWQYYETIDGTQRFLRVYLLEEDVSVPNSGIPKKSVSYLRFFKNGFPKPHGTGENVVPL